MGYSDAPKIAVDVSGDINSVYVDGPDGPLRRYQIRRALSKAGGGDNLWWYERDQMFSLL